MCMVNDTLSDMVTRIRNASMVKKSTVSIPCTKMNQKIAYILEKEGFLQSVVFDSELKMFVLKLKYRSKKTGNGKTKEPCITNLKRMSRPGLRLYTKSQDIPRLLGGAGIYILSTSLGILTDREARAFGVGGELLCSIW
jgi:small subunit ribosomal protein S8